MLNLTVRKDLATAYQQYRKLARQRIIASTEVNEASSRLQDVDTELEALEKDILAKEASLEVPGI